MQLVIFDCDGVLVNSEAIYVAAELEFLAGLGLAYERQAYMQAFMGLAPAEWRSKVAAALEAQTGRAAAAGIFATLDALVTQQVDARLAALPGAREAIAELRIARCVASSTGTARLHWKLTHTGLIDLFAPHIFSAEMVGRGKPAPDLFRHAAAAVGVAPGRCIVVEDSANGVRAGKAAGMTVVGFTAGDHCSPAHGAMLKDCGADIVVDSFAALGEAMQALIGDQLVGDQLHFE